MTKPHGRQSDLTEPDPCQKDTFTETPNADKVHHGQNQIMSETELENLKSGEKAPDLSNGWRYPQVGGLRKRQFDGTSFKSHKELENAQTPRSRLHVLLDSR